MTTSPDQQALATSAKTDTSVQRWVERLADAATTGREIDLAGGLACDPASADEWSLDRTLPAAALREILTRPDLPVDPRGLRIRGARIIDDIDLAYVKFDHPLHLIECRLDGETNMEQVVLRELKLTGTHTRDINLDLAEINGAIYADDGFTVTGSFRAIAAIIKSQLILTRATFVNPGGSALELDGATIANGLIADAAETNGFFSASGVHVGGGFNLNGATLSNPFVGVALFLAGAEITGAMSARQVTVNGAISAEGVRIRGSLFLNAATLANPGREVLDLSDGVIGANVMMSDGFKATGEVKVVAAQIGGDLNASNASLANTGTALRLTRATIAGSLRGRKVEMCCAFEEVPPQGNGVLLAQGAQIGGQVDLSDARFANANFDSILTVNFDSAKVAAGVDLTRVECEGAFYAFGARIGGPLVLAHANFHNPLRAALFLDSAEIAGSVLAERCETNGEFHAKNVHIAGDLRLHGAGLSNPGHDALVLDDVDIPAKVFADNGFSADGRISAVSSRIAELHLADATLTADGNSVALCLEGAQVRELELQSTDIRRSETESAQGGDDTDGVIDLTRAVIGRLKTPEGLPAPGRLVATGWDIADLDGGLRKDACAAQWLEKTSLRSELSVQPWHSLASVYERNGDVRGSRRLRLAAANRVTRKVRWLPTKVVRTAYRLIVGHGYYPLRAAWWLLLVIAAGALLVALNLSSLVPTDVNAAKSSYTTQTGANPPRPITGETSCSSLGGYPCANPLTFTLSSLMPTVGANSNAGWRIESPWLDIALSCLKLTAWLLSVLLLAGVTGLLRKS